MKKFNIIEKHTLIGAIGPSNRREINRIIYGIKGLLNQSGAY